MLDDEIVRHLVECPAAMANMKRVLFRIYSFYSFEIAYFDDGTYELNLSDSSRKPWWVSVGNHNYLRLARILLTLRDLGLHDDLFALTDILDVLYRKHSGLIGATTYAHWFRVSDTLT